MANYSGSRRRLDSYATPELALEAANKLARQLSEREVLAASLTNKDAVSYSGAILALAPFRVGLPETVDVVAKCLELVGDLPTLHQAAKDYASRNRRIARKALAEVVEELLAVKAKRGKSVRYLQDLSFRLRRFAADCVKEASDVSTADVQSWLDAMKASPQSYENFRRTTHTLFAFAVARGYAAENPVRGVERVKASGGPIQILRPQELERLLNAAPWTFKPCLALQAFAGLRSSEVERLEWTAVDLTGRHITVGKAESKTASRRLVPVGEALESWLRPYLGETGKVWQGTHQAYYHAQRDTAAKAGLKWRHNALRHSYASYRLAEIADAGRTAAELGNSAAMVFKHYRQLVTPAVAKAWFSLRVDVAENVVALPSAAEA